MSGLFRRLCLIVLLRGWSAFGQTTPNRLPSETHQYAIEVANLRVGTLTATRQAQPNGQQLFTLTSDVKVNLLLYKVKIYYKVINRVQNGKLMLSTVEAHTNRGDFGSRTEWKTDHYDIMADQYNYHQTGTEPRRIDYTVTDLFFGEPTGHRDAFAEYFGDYFALSPTTAGHYNALRQGHTDEYIYKNGQLIKIIKKNPIKNFIIRLLY